MKIGKHGLTENRKSLPLCKTAQQGSIGADAHLRRYTLTDNDTCDEYADFFQLLLYRRDKVNVQKNRDAKMLRLCFRLYDLKVLIQ